jgi:hypothetical protein
MPPEPSHGTTIVESARTSPDHPEIEPSFASDISVAIVVIGPRTGGRDRIANPSSRWVRTTMGSGAEPGRGFLRPRT